MQPENNINNELWCSLSNSSKFIQTPNPRNVFDQTTMQTKLWHNPCLKNIINFKTHIHGALNVINASSILMRQSTTSFHAFQRNKRAYHSRAVSLSIIILERRRMNIVSPSYQYVLGNVQLLKYFSLSRYFALYAFTTTICK